MSNTLYVNGIGGICDIMVFSAINSSDIGMHLNEGSSYAPFPGPCANVEGHPLTHRTLLRS